METVLYIIVALLVLSIMVVIHELGHYSVGRAVGLTVVEFAVGMGPKLLSKVKNGIIYSIRAFPIGGFCAFLGEDSELDNPKALNRQPAWKRFVMTLAGPAANIVFAWLLTIVLLMAVGESVPYIKNVTAGMPAAQAGILPGDKVTAVNGEGVSFNAEAMTFISQAEGDTVKITVERGGGLETFDVGFASVDENGASRRVIGVGFDGTLHSFGFFEAIGLSFKWIIFIMGQLLTVLAGLITGTQSTAAVTGPVGTVAYIGEIARSGFYSLCRMSVLISVNLGLFNLIPFPGLDGSRLVFNLLEMVRRKPLPAEKEGMVHFIGLVVLIGLMVLLTFQDIVRLIGGGVGG